MNSNSIRYFRECYQADNRRSVLGNIYHKSIDYRIPIEGREDLLNGFLYSISLDPEKGRELRKAAHLYRAEKELLYASMFIVGSLKDEQDQRQAICAPLFTHAAEITEDESGHVLLSIDHESRYINYQLLDLIGTADEEGHIGIDLAAEVGTEPITFAEIGRLAEFLQDWTPEIECQDLYFYPELWLESSLRRLLKESVNNKKDMLRAVPFSTLLLLPKSVQTRGVLNELEAIAEAERISQPLQTLLEQKSLPSHVSKKNIKPGRIPAVLSGSQQQALAGAVQEPLSMIVGPPGTGKSFTIACIAMEHLHRGESVLIASKMNHAVDVVGTIIEERLGISGLIVRGGRSQYLRNLKAYLEGLLSGMLVESEIEEQFQIANKKMKRLEQRVQRLNREFDKMKKRWIQYSEILTSEQQGVLGTMKKFWIRWRAGRSRSLRDILHDIEKSSLFRIEEVINVLTMQRQVILQQVLKKNRSELSSFLSGIRARRGGRREEIFDQLDFQTLFKVFPLWLTNLSDVSRTLPLRCELFDLAIIDEATQCDIASCLPIFQRAKRVVITGDAKQLRHLSFLSRKQQTALQEKYGLKEKRKDLYDYRSLSILDIVDYTLSSQDQVSFLDEHYRSLPDIIGYSNREFYNNRLRVMKGYPQLEKKDSCYLHLCKGEQKTNGVNVEEAQQVIDDVKRLIESEKSLPKGDASSIGLLSPFRIQSDYLADILRKELSSEMIERHDIMVGTAYTFQGEERDYMFISFAVDAGAHHARLRYLNRADAFNVSITRARKEQRIYLSVPVHQLQSDSYLRSYVEYIQKLSEQDNRLQSGKGVPSGRFQREVANMLKEKGYHLVWDWNIGGLELDIMVIHETAFCGITFLSSSSQALSLERYRMLFRAGVPIIPLAEADWITHQTACLSTIDSVLRSSNWKGYS